MSKRCLGVQIYSDIRRPSPDLLRKIGEFPVAMISDAMGKLNTMTYEIKPIYKEIKTMVGPAFTVLARPGDNLMAMKAIEIAKPGDVVVVSNWGHNVHSVWGGIMSVMAVKRGIAGLVTDGLVRDVVQTRESGFPVWSRGLTPLAPARGIPPGQINTPVVCGGISVLPGDIIVADEDGVVAVPLELAHLVLEACQARKAKEDGWLDGIDNGVYTLLEEANRTLTENKAVIHLEADNG